MYTRGQKGHRGKHQPWILGLNLSRENIRSPYPSSVPTNLIGLMDHPERPQFNLSSLKRITYAGSPMAVVRIKEALKIFGPVLDQSYCQAESIITITHLSKYEHILNGDPNRASDDWYPPGDNTQAFSTIQYEVRDDHDKPLDLGNIGEVITRSDFVMWGYWNQTDKTEEALRGGWLHTGHIGYLDEDGYLYLGDRKHDKIITGGLNVFL